MIYDLRSTTYCVQYNRKRGNPMRFKKRWACGPLILQLWQKVSALFCFSKCPFSASWWKSSLSIVRSKACCGRGLRVGEGGFVRKSRCSLSCLCTKDRRKRSYLLLYSEVSYEVRLLAIRTEGKISEKAKCVSAIIPVYKWDRIYLELYSLFI